MPDDDPADAESPDCSPIRDNWTANTDPYERALSALLTPRGDRLTEIAARNEVDPDILREVAARYVHDHRILVESDGERADPRLHRNEAMSFFGAVWREFSYAADREALEARRDELAAEIDAYRDETGYDDPDALVAAFDDEDADFSHIDTPDTGELFWDVVTPWRDALHRRHLVEFALDNHDTLAELAGFIDIDDPEPYGDFADINAVEAKLGLEDDPPTDAWIDEDGVLHREDEA